MKVGLIGCGNMGGAMLSGMLESGALCPGDVLVSVSTEESARKKEQQYQVKVTTDNCAVARFAEVLILAVKPQFYEDVISEIRDVVCDGKRIVSVAPGKTIEWLSEKFKRDLKFIRTMPNTPSLVKEGMMGICAGERVTAEELAAVRALFAGFSKTEIVNEHLMDVVTAVSGSSPAYVFMFIEAMADAAVAGGMPRSLAYTFVAQAVLGSAKMVLDTGRHPGELKDMVCSPGGTTIRAVRVLEEKGLRSAVMEAMAECLEASRRM